MFEFDFKFFSSFAFERTSEAELRLFCLNERISSSLKSYPHPVRSLRGVPVYKHEIAEF